MTLINKGSNSGRKSNVVRRASEKKRRVKQRAQPVGTESWVLLAISRAITQIKVRLLMIIYLASLVLGLQFIPHKHLPCFYYISFLLSRITVYKENGNYIVIYRHSGMISNSILFREFNECLSHKHTFGCESDTVSFSHWHNRITTDETEWNIFEKCWQGTVTCFRRQYCY